MLLLLHLARASSESPRITATGQPSLSVAGSPARWKLEIFNINRAQGPATIGRRFVATRPSLTRGLTRVASADDVDVIIRWGKTGAGTTRSELQARAGPRDDGTPALGRGVLAAFHVSAGVDIRASPSPVPSPVPVFVLKSASLVSFRIPAHPPVCCRT